ncbi:MAG: transposase [Bacteroidales bacterium]|nr:transposase [Bacteroidales bacterium]
MRNFITPGAGELLPVDECRSVRDDGGYYANHPPDGTGHPLPASVHWFSLLAAALDPRSAPRLAWLLVGAVLARGRRTVTSWIRAADLSNEYRPCYATVAAAGTRTDRIAARLLTTVVKPLVAGAPRITLALDDTPTERAVYYPHRSDPVSCPKC